jgi:hypothetical protein
MAQLGIFPRPREGDFSQTPFTQGANDSSPQMGICTRRRLPRSSQNYARPLRFHQDAGPTGSTSSRPVQKAKVSRPTLPTCSLFYASPFPHADCGRFTVVSVCGMGVVLALHARTSCRSCISVQGELNYAYSSNIPYSTLFLHLALRPHAEPS